MALPGVTTVLKDRFYTVSRTDAPAGPRVLAIATRDTEEFTEDTLGNAVADYDPYSPRSEADCIAAFGEGSGCHRAYLEMVAGGAVRTSIVALPQFTTDDMIVGGSAGVSGENVMDEAFAAAETARADIIVPWGRGGHANDWQDPATPGDDLEFGFYADNGTLAKQVADKVQEISDRSHPCFAVIGVKPYVGAGTAATEGITAANIATHLGLAGLPDHNDVTFGNNGPYLTVIGTELNVLGYPRNTDDLTRAGAFGYSNGAGLFAGYVSQLDPWRAATGKQIFNVSGLRYNPTRTQQESMIGKGVIPVSVDFNRIPTWVDALTFGKSTSDYTRLSTLRIVFSAIQGIRRVAQNYIGEAATLHNRNAFETSITALLRGMTQVGALLNSDFVVTYVPRESKAIVDLILRPAFELRNIEIQVSVDL